MAHFYQEIGKRIRQLRREKGFSQGKMRIFADHISKLSEVLGVTTDYLIYGNGKKDE